MKTRTLLMAAGLFFAAQGAFAMPYAETGDAPHLIPGQAVPGGTTSITGNGGSGDVDMYGFNWGGGALQIDTFAPFTFDTQLFLFDSAGFGVVGNDDHGGICAGMPGSGLQSCLDLTGGLAAGSYYLGISAFNNDPLDGTNTSMMSNCGFSEQCPGGTGPLASWSGASTDPGMLGYTINFSAATTSVPEPGTVLLLGLGLAGLGFARRRA